MKTTNNFTRLSSNSSNRFPIFHRGPLTEWYTRVRHLEGTRTKVRPICRSLILRCTITCRPQLTTNRWSWGLSYRSTWNPRSQPWKPSQSWTATSTVLQFTKSSIGTMQPTKRMSVPATKVRWKNLKLCQDLTNKQYTSKNKGGREGCETRNKALLMTSRLYTGGIFLKWMTTANSKCKHTENSSKKSCAKNRNKCRSKKSSLGFPWAAWRIR